VPACPPQGIASALGLSWSLGLALRRPWVMVSVNDDEDLHFRKASFDATRCPPDCPRPCEAVCPTAAIPPLTSTPSSSSSSSSPSSSSSSFEPNGGFVEGVGRPERCYGCGRCLGVCPLGLITAESYVVDARSVLASLGPRVDALEIHTGTHYNDSQPGGASQDRFRELWASVGPAAVRLKAVAVSFPDLGKGATGPFLRALAGVMGGGRGGPRINIWQADGRPMSGDVGAGATHRAVRFGEDLLGGGALPFGAGRHFVQLAGGTNAHTVPKLMERGLLALGGGGGGDGSRHPVHGLAFGGYARRVVGEAMEAAGVGDDDRPEDLGFEVRGRSVG
jgi:Fe-S-cluster-containing hydrogenase component 2